jgi:hypothetical protein
MTDQNCQAGCEFLLIAAAAAVHFVALLLFV